MTQPLEPLILVVDDATDLFDFACLHLGPHYRLEHAPNGRAAMELLRRAEKCSALLLDRDFSSADPEGLLGPREESRDEGIRILHWLRREHPGVPVIMVTSHRELEVAVQAGRLGADFLAWEDVSVEPAALSAIVEKAIAAAAEPDESILARFRDLGIVVESPSFARTLVHLHHAAKDTYPIRLQGETGTGKDTLAWAIHALDPRGGDRPFVPVNLAALNASLLDRELFGHARGAFTGAFEARPGVLRAAHGGTLFLNEITELSPEHQAKFLTALERREVVPVGSVEAQPAEFRLVTASSRDLGAEVEAGRFRSDLFFRIDYHCVDLPPLRARQEEIPALARLFLRDACGRRTDPVYGFSREAIEYLRGRPWPGNVRQLCTVIVDAAAHACHTVTIRDVMDAVARREAGEGSAARTGAPATAPASVRAPVPAESVRPTTTGEPRVAASAEATAVLDGTYLELTRRYYEALHRRTGGKIPEMARLAGIARSTMYEWKQRFDPDPASDSEPAPTPDPE